MVVKNEEAAKSQLAVEICELGSCAHSNTKTTPSFVNWYLVLRVDKNADAECIRKQYLKLAALQLHPDKNKHAKAETAFKLVSQAYSCLSDNARRAAFDLQRRSFLLNTRIISNQMQEAFMSKRQNKSARMHKLVEALISSTRQKMNGKNETPVFNPADYQHKGYPHYRKTAASQIGKSFSPTSGTPVFQGRTPFSVNLHW